MHTTGNKPHRDLAIFKKMRKDALEDGTVTPKEKKQLARAFDRLEPGERRAVKRGKKPAHRDARVFRGKVKAALEDGRIGPQERKQLIQAFERMEPGEKARAIHRLAESGHGRLANLLRQAS